MAATIRQYYRNTMPLRELPSAAAQEAGMEENLPQTKRQAIQAQRSAETLCVRNLLSIYYKHRTNCMHLDLPLQHHAVHVV